MSRSWIAAVLVAGLALGSPAWAAGTAALPLKTVADIPLPGRSTRLDYQSLDATRQLLFIAHLGDGTVTVVDTRAQQAVANVAGVSQVHGVLAIPELGRVYATATGSHQVVAIDEARFTVTATMSGGSYPDGLAWAPPAHKLYVSDKRGAAVVIDAASNRSVATIALGSEVGNIQYDAGSGHVLANVQSASELAEIDPATDRVVGRHPLPGCQGNHGLLIEPHRRLAFVACEDNARLLVVDLRTRQVVATHAVGPDPDVLAFDPGLALLYVASESGVLSMFKVGEHGLDRLGQARVAAGAHSVAVDTKTHRVYLPLANLEGRPVLRVMEPTL